MPRIVIVLLLKRELLILSCRDLVKGHTYIKLLMECAKGFLSDVVDTFAYEAFVTLLVAIDTDDELELAATLKLMTDRVGYLPKISVGFGIWTQWKKSGNNVSFFSQSFQSNFIS